jgi:DNA-directed RNA polymerase subunit RPC12/RpoP
MNTVTFKCEDCGTEHTFNKQTADGHKCAVCGFPILKFIGENIRTSEDAMITRKRYREQNNHSNKQTIEEALNDGVIYNKPPLGIEPRWIHDGRRRDILINAFYRYITAGKEIPSEWLAEYNKITKNFVHYPHPYNVLN